MKKKSLVLIDKSNNLNKVSPNLIEFEHESIQLQLSFSQVCTDLCYFTVKAREIQSSTKFTSTELTLTALGLEPHDEFTLEQIHEHFNIGVELSTHGWPTNLAFTDRNSNLNVERKLTILWMLPSDQPNNFQLENNLEPGNAIQRHEMRQRSPVRRPIAANNRIQRENRRIEENHDEEIDDQFDQQRIDNNREEVRENINPNPRNARIADNHPRNEHNERDIQREEPMNNQNRILSQEEKVDALIQRINLLEEKVAQNERRQPLNNENIANNERECDNDRIAEVERKMRSEMEIMKAQMARLEENMNKQNEAYKKDLARLEEKLARAEKTIEELTNKSLPSASVQKQPEPDQHPCAKIKIQLINLNNLEVKKDIQSGICLKPEKGKAVSRIDKIVDRIAEDLEDSSLFKEDFDPKLLNQYQHTDICKLTNCLDIDGSEYIVASTDGLVKLKNKKTHKVTRIFKKEHTDWIWSLLAIDNRLITGSDDTLIKVWDLADVTKDSIATLCHGSYVFSLLHVRDEIIASGGGSQHFQIKLWDLKDYKCIKTLTNHTHSVWGMLMNSSELLISVSFDKSIRIWEISDFIEESSQLLSINTEKEMTSCILLNKSTIAVGTKTSIDIFELQSQQLQYSLSGHTDWIWRILRLSPSLIASCSDDKTVRVWDINQKNQVRLMQGSSSFINGILRLSNSQVLCVLWDHTVTVWG